MFCLLDEANNVFNMFFLTFQRWKVQSNCGCAIETSLYLLFDFPVITKQVKNIKLHAF